MAQVFDEMWKNDTPIPDDMQTLSPGRKTKSSKRRLQEQEKAMEINDWYIGKDVRASQEERGRKVTTLQYIVAAVQQANEDHITAEQLVEMIYEANKFSPKKIEVRQNLKDLGF